jgi:hypothetical protein
MDSQLRSRAEASLVDAAEASGLTDPRPAYREYLRALRQSRPEAFDQAVEHYEKNVLPALVDAEPLPVWIEYGRFLASLTSAGEAVTIDASGRAAPWTREAPAGLVLFVPEENAADVMVLSQPVTPTPAQQATLTLLVERKLAVSG